MLELTKFNCAIQTSNHDIYLCNLRSEVYFISSISVFTTVFPFSFCRTSGLSVMATTFIPKRPIAVQQPPPPEPISGSLVVVSNRICYRITDVLPYNYTVVGDNPLPYSSSHEPHETGSFEPCSPDGSVVPPHDTQPLEQHFLDTSHAYDYIPHEARILSINHVYVPRKAHPRCRPNSISEHEERPLYHPCSIGKPPPHVVFQPVPSTNNGYEIYYFTTVDQPHDVLETFVSEYGHGEEPVELCTVDSIVEAVSEKGVELEELCTVDPIMEAVSENSEEPVELCTVDPIMETVSDQSYASLDASIRSVCHSTTCFPLPISLDSDVRPFSDSAYNSGSVPML